jgi:hypothetical protein
MKSENRETRTWASFHTHAAAQLSSGFPDHVLREARARAIAVPSLLSQVAISAATAALCFLAVAIVDARTSRATAASNVADWQQIVSASEELAQAQ